MACSPNGSSIPWIGGWVEFHLRPEAQFANGDDVTAADVVFSLDAIKDKGAPRVSDSV